MDEIENRFATNGIRKQLYQGFFRGAEALRLAGCAILFLDGSFVSGKPSPGDFDVCWDPIGVDVEKLDPVMLDFSEMRRSQKEKYGGEFFPSSIKADGTRTFVEFFQVDKDTGRAKGILRVQL